MEEIFPFGRPVRGRHLVGRDKEIERILSMVDKNQSVMLVAPRRYGKTSIVLEVLERFKEKDRYVGRVDLFDIPTKEKLAEKIVQSTIENKVISAERIIRSAKKGIGALKEIIELKHITRDGMEIVLNFGDAQKDIDTLLDEILDFPENFSEKNSVRMCFAYDEFGDISRMNGTLVKKMRSKFQLHQRTAYLFSGSKESVMNEIFREKKGAFYGFCDVVELPPIPRKDFKDYIHESFEEAGMTITPPVIDSILDNTACHPYFTQYLSHIIYLNTKENKKVKNDDVQRCFEQVMQLQETYLDDIWSTIKQDSILQLKICMFLATHPKKSVYSVFDDSRQNVYAALQSLIRKGYVRHEKEGYELMDPLLKEYLRRKDV